MEFLVMRMAKVKVTRNHQVTIPREVRKKMKLREGDLVKLEAVDPQRAMLKRIIPPRRWKVMGRRDGSGNIGGEETLERLENAQVLCVDTDILERN